MNRKNRIPEIHFYEWSITRWFTSSTRQLLDATGRGIFRELLDLCYAQGGIPKDPRLQAAFCGCTVEDIERVWPVIKKHFRAHKNDENLLVNAYAELERRQYFAFVESQRSKGRSGGRPMRT